MRNFVAECAMRIAKVEWRNVIRLNIFLSVAIACSSRSAAQVSSEETRSRLDPRVTDCTGYYRLIGQRPISDADAIGNVLSGPDAFSLLPGCQAYCSGNGECAAFVVHFATNSAQCTFLRTPTSTEAGSVVELLEVANSMVFVKTCITRAVPCNSLWQFDTMLNMQVQPDDVFKVVPATSVDACLAMCLSEEPSPCRSLSFDLIARNCYISHVSGRQRSSSPMPTPKSVYFENQCATESRSNCHFSEVNSTADAFALLQIVTDNQAACEEECLSARTFQCRSYSYAPVEHICRLSADDSFSSPSTEDANSALVHERGICIDVKVLCTSGTMVGQFSTNRLLDGKAYTVNGTQSCSFDIGRRATFNVTISFEDDAERCGIRADKNMLSALVSVQYHQSVITAYDRAFQLVCSFDLGSRVVENTVELRLLGQYTYLHRASSTTKAPFVVTAAGELPTLPEVYMRVVNRNGQTVSTAEIGQELFAEVVLNDQAGQSQQYALFVTECTADEESGQILLIDQLGCPTDTSVFEAFYPTTGNNQQILRAAFQGFRFREKQRVNINCNVNFCFKFCQPGLCSDRNGRRIMSYGRRRRRAVPELSFRIGTDLMLGQSVEAIVSARSESIVISWHISYLYVTALCCVTALTFLIIYRIIPSSVWPVA